MAGIPIDKAEVENEIETIKGNKLLTEEARKASIHVVIKKSFARRQKSHKTIFSIANTMMGSAVLVMPINFYKSGLISSLICSAFVGFISFKTANLPVLHSRHEEFDINEAIIRILSKKWNVFFNILSAILLYLSGIIYFILMSNTLYSIVKNIAPGGSNWPSSSQILFDQFSIQYVGIILFFLCALLFSLKDIKSVLKVNSLGIYAIITYIVFIFYLGIYYLSTTDIQYQGSGTPGEANYPQIILFTSNLETLFGVFALAFMIHNLIVGIMKNNEKPEHNTRDLAIAYCINASVYSGIGIMGTFSVAALYATYKTDETAAIPGTIMDLLTKSNFNTSETIGYFNFIFSIIATTFVLIQLTTVIPILCFFTRKQFFNLLYGENVPIPDLKFHAFNIFYAISCLIIEILALDPSIVISLNGAVCGFFLIYVIPISMHIKCLYGDKEDKSIETQSKNDENPSDSLVFGNKYSPEREKTYNEQLVQPEKEECLDHQNLLKDNKYIIYIFYGFLTLVGFAIMVGQLIHIID